MKKYVNIIAIMIVICMAFALPVSAETVIMRGYTDSSANGVSILITKTSEITSDNIVWVDQQSVNADGSFVISVPLFTQEGYTVHSNALEFTDEISDSLTMYVSEAGTGHGFDAQNPSNLQKVYAMLGSLESVTVILTGDVTYSDAPKAYSEKLSIKGQNGAEILTLPEAVTLNGKLTVDNLTLSGSSTIYASGHELVITDKVTSTSNLTVYGGNNGSDLTGDTSLKLYGGSYKNIYGGCYKDVVNGNTNVIVGGNATALHSTEDDSYQCVYGGGNGGTVTGKTNVTLEGNAKVDYLVGAGTGTAGTVTETNINIAGGEVMNVYAGSRSVALTNCNTHINMTGGKVEALFGGCESKTMTGNTYISVKGGEVTRRIYGGCYNGTSGTFSLTWKDTDNHVIGTTNIFLYPEAKLVTGSGLSLEDRANMGIFGGSRRQISKGSSTDEIDTIFFMDGCYSSFNSKIKDTGIIHSDKFKSFHDYMVNSAAGGSVVPDAAGSVTVSLPQGKSAWSGEKRYFDGQKIQLAKDGVTTITYDGITSASATENTTGVNTNVRTSGSTTGKLLAAIYDGDNNFITCSFASVNATTKSYDIPLTCKLDSDKNYNIRFFFWDSNEKLVPVTTVYSLKLR